jgi:uncharacterized protein (TIGR02594 family)
MVQLVAFCRSPRAVSLRIVALALCSAAMVASVSPASAKSHHGVARHKHAVSSHAHVRHVRHHTGRHYAYRHYRHHRHALLASRTDDSSPLRSRGRLVRSRGIASAASTETTASSAGFGSSSIVAEARRYLGGSNPTGRASLWCARFMNMVLQHTGFRGTGSDMALSFASYGHRVSGPQVGAIAVMGRRGGGHVGVVSGIDAHGNPILVSGNNGNRVREAPVSRGRIYAYVVPTS